MPSPDINGDALEHTCRLVHVDGSHTYEVVHEDIITARRLLGAGGVVAFDDWSTFHAPGVALAVWEEYLRGELIPLCLTPLKFYATWDPGGLTHNDVEAWAAGQPNLDMTWPHGLWRRDVRIITLAAPQQDAGPIAQPVDAPPTPAGVHGSPRTDVRSILRRIARPISLVAYRHLRDRLRRRRRRAG